MLLVEESLSGLRADFPSFFTFKLLRDSLQLLRVVSHQNVPHGALAPVKALVRVHSSLNQLPHQFDILRSHRFLKILDGSMHPKLAKEALSDDTLGVSHGCLAK